MSDEDGHRAPPDEMVVVAGDVTEVAEGAEGIEPPSGEAVPVEVIEMVEVVDPAVRRDRTRVQALRAIAVAGIIVSVFVSVVAWRFLGDLQRNVDQSLSVGADAAATLTETIDVTAGVIESLDAGLETLDGTLVTVDGTMSETGALARSTADLAGMLPDSFADIDAALATVESLGATIDTALFAASQIPLGPRYDPDVPLSDAIAEVRAALDPVGGQLRDISAELGTFAGRAGELGRDIGDIRTEIEASREAVGESAALLDRYRDTAVRVQELADSSRQELARSMTWMRISLVLLALVLLAFQYVPWVLAAQIIERRREADAVKR